MTIKTPHHTPVLFKNTLIILCAGLIFIGLPILVANHQVSLSRHYHSPMSLEKNVKLAPMVNTIKFFTSQGYDLEDVRKKRINVPPLYLTHIPRELPYIQNVYEKKKLFFSTLLPPILKVNDYILQERKELKRLIGKLAQGRDLTTSELFWLVKKLERYRVKVSNPQEFLDRTDQILTELMSRINIIPPSMALAQAAQESGWGTSRFAQQGNALFGQWIWGKGCGIVPKARNNGATHRIKCYKSVLEAVEDYIRNLNTHSAYEALRSERNRFTDHQSINVVPLIETLIFYSEEGEDYIHKIKNIIRINRLTDFEDSTLDDTLVNMKSFTSN